MPRATPKDKVAETAHFTAWIRTLGRLTADRDVANGDYLAEHFLLPFQRWTTHAPRFSRWVLERVMPGGFGYFNARTRYFDEILVQEAVSGVDQLVLLGAGFDSRPVRFAAQLSGARVFEVDMPQVLRIRAERLRRAGASSPSIPVPIDFERENLADVLSSHGFRAHVRTLFLWEGVTYYLPPTAVDAVLASVAKLGGPGSSILFDYVTQAFFEGDERSYGAEQLAAGWRKMGNVHRSGVSEVSALLQPHGLCLRADVDALELERRYLACLPGAPLHAWGMMHIAHADR